MIAIDTSNPAPPKQIKRGGSPGGGTWCRMGVREGAGEREGRFCVDMAISRWKSGKPGRLPHPVSRLRGVFHFPGACLPFLRGTEREDIMRG